MIKPIQNHPSFCIGNYMKNTLRIQTNPKYKLISTILAFFAWGGWAFYANRAFDLSTRAVSGITQGIASVIITLVMIQIVTWIFSQITNRYLQSIFPAVITVSITGSGLIFVHYLVGTPEIITTVAPGLICAFFFCLLTTYKLIRI